MPDPDRSPRSEMRSGMKILAMAWVMAAAIVVGGAVGWWIDRELGTSPLLMLAGLGAGIAGGGFYAYRTVMKVLNE